jgi:3-oxoacyl-[acyl-carrier protein] reductase
MTDIFDHLYPTEESRDQLLKKIPIGRFGLPEDVANMACFLAGEAASYVHGQIILLDGGRTY